MTLERKVGEEDRLFGSVTTKDVAAALKEKGIEIDRKRIELPEVRTAGTFTVTAKLLGEVTRRSSSRSSRRSNAPEFRRKARGRFSLQRAFFLVRARDLNARAADE